jgi:hypothetical protein
MHTEAALSEIKNLSASTKDVFAVCPVITVDGKVRVALDVLSVTPDGTVYVSPESPIVADVPLAGDHLSAFISLLILI